MQKFNYMTLHFDNSCIILTDFSYYVCFVSQKLLVREKHRHPINVKWSSSKPYYKHILTDKRLKTLI